MSLKKWIWLKILRARDSALRMPNDTSQSLESTKLFAILKDHPKKWIVEVGANDGVSLSNSNLFIRKDWDALLIEPVPSSIAQAKVVHGSNPKVKFEQCAISRSDGFQEIYLDKSGKGNFFATLETESTQLRDKFVGDDFILVKTSKLDNVLEANMVPVEFAILSIDVEGHEAEVLSNLGHFRPSVILIERNLSSLTKAFEKQKFLTEKDYLFAARIGCNEVYVDVTNLFILDNLSSFEKLSSIGI